MLTSFDMCSESSSGIQSAYQLLSISQKPVTVARSILSEESSHIVEGMRGYIEAFDYDDGCITIVFNEKEFSEENYALKLNAVPIRDLDETKSTLYPLNETNLDFISDDEGINLIIARMLSEPGTKDIDLASSLFRTLSGREDVSENREDEFRPGQLFISGRQMFDDVNNVNIPALMVFQLGEKDDEPALISPNDDMLEKWNQSCDIVVYPTQRLLKSARIQTSQDVFENPIFVDDDFLRYADLRPLSPEEIDFIIQAQTRNQFLENCSETIRKELEVTSSPENVSPER